MDISADDELDVGVPLNVEDDEVSKIGDPAVQVGQFAPGNHKSEEPVSRTTSNDWDL